MPGTESAYSGEDLAWYAEHYGDTAWMVHVHGPDECPTHADPDLDEDDPKNSVLDEAGALKLAQRIADHAAWYAIEFPGDDNPQISATIFRFGVPWGPEPITEEN